jgi:hypothetical protein
MKLILRKTRIKLIKKLTKIEVWQTLFFGIVQYDPTGDSNLILKI